MDQYTYGAELLKKYEGFTSRATWDVNAYRLGYGSDTLTFENNTYRKVKQGDTTTKANATKDLERRLKEFEKKVIKKVGSEYIALVYRIVFYPAFFLLQKVFRFFSY